MTLAGLRDSENSIMSYDEVNDQVSGITMWGALTVSGFTLGTMHSGKDFYKKYAIKVKQ